MMRAVFFFLIFFLFAFSKTDAYAGIASLRDRWPAGRQISVCFFSEPQKLLAEIASIAKEWTKDLSVQFDFGPSDAPNLCRKDQPFDVRVSFDKDENVSFAHSRGEAKSIPQNKPTINLPISFKERLPSNARGFVLHQFGHVLGFLHFEQDPNLKCEAEFDFDLAKKIGLSEDLLRRLARPDNGKFISTSAAGKSSVMRAFNDYTVFRRGLESPCYGPPTDVLSEDDRKLAQLTYPIKPSDVSSAAAKHVTIRFEGQLAAEHFG